MANWEGMFSFKVKSVFGKTNTPVKYINHESSNYTKDATDLSCSIINTPYFCVILSDTHNAEMSTNRKHSLKSVFKLY